MSDKLKKEMLKMRKEDLFNELYEEIEELDKYQVMDLMIEHFNVDTKKEYQELINLVKKFKESINK